MWKVALQLSFYFIPARLPRRRCRACTAAQRGFASLRRKLRFRAAAAAPRDPRSGSQPEGMPSARGRWVGDFREAIHKCGSIYTLLQSETKVSDCNRNPAQRLL